MKKSKKKIININFIKNSQKKLKAKKKRISKQQQGGIFILNGNNLGVLPAGSLHLGRFLKEGHTETTNVVGRLFRGSTGNKQERNFFYYFNPNNPSFPHSIIYIDGNVGTDIIQDRTLKTDRTDFTIKGWINFPYIDFRFENSPEDQSLLGKFYLSSYSNEQPVLTLFLTSSQISQGSGPRYHYVDLKKKINKCIHKHYIERLEKNSTFQLQREEFIANTDTNQLKEIFPEESTYMNNLSININRFSLFSESREIIEYLNQTMNNSENTPLRPRNLVQFLYYLTLLNEMFYKDQTPHFLFGFTASYGKPLNFGIMKDSNTNKFMVTNHVDIQIIKNVESLLENTYTDLQEFFCIPQTENIEIKQEQIKVKY